MCKFELYSNYIAKINNFLSFYFNKKIQIFIFYKIYFY